MVRDGPAGEYIWWELSHDDVTVPVTAGAFGYTGLYNDRPYFVQGEDAWFLWHDDAVSSYVLTDELGTGNGPGHSWWEADIINTPWTTYNPLDDAVGNITIDAPADAFCTVTKLT